MPDDLAPANDVVDTVTAPVEPTETEAHEILESAVESAEGVAGIAEEVAEHARSEAEIEAARAEGERHGALDSAAMLSTVRDALDAHISEHHAAPVAEEPSEESHEAAVTIDVPPLDEIAPEVTDTQGAGATGDVTVTRRRRILRRR